MTTLNLIVGASADDAKQAIDGSVVINGTTIEVDDENEWGGLRWQNVTIPPGATIVSAILTVNILGAGTDEPILDIYGEAADNAAAFSAGGVGSNGISGRPRTTATVFWDAANLGSTVNQYWSAPDLSTIVQEIVNRAGWASGNALVIVFHQRPPTIATRDFTINAWDNAASGIEAKLDIVYTATGANWPERQVTARGVGRGMMRGGR